MTLGEIAKLTGAELLGDPAHVVTGAAGLAEASGTDVSFLENPRYAAQVAASKAGAVFLPPAAKDFAGGPANRFYSAAPKRDYAKVLALLDAERRPRDPAGISAKADVHPEARVDAQACVGSFSVVREGAQIGAGSQVSAQCYVGRGVKIGKDCLIHPQVVIADHCELGDRVIIHSGTVIGSDGYGYWTDMKDGRHHKVAQVGKVVVESDVEIGSNVSIDRATTGETRIGAGSKIDNLVQVGHNVTTGRNCLLVSQVGLAGSTKLGHQVTLGGQVGVAGHLSIGDGAMVGAQSGIMSDVEPKAVLFGTPVRPHREAMKLQALFSKLPEMYEALKELRKSKKEKEADAHA